MSSLYHRSRLRLVIALCSLSISAVACSYFVGTPVEPDDPPDTPTGVPEAAEAKGGPDRLVTVGEVVTLDGSESTPGVTAEGVGGTVVSLTWTLKNAPAGSNATITVLDEVLGIVQFTVDRLGAYEVELVIRDSNEFASADAVFVRTLHVESASPASGPAETVVTVNGMHFQDQQGTADAWIGGDWLPRESASPTALAVRVPRGTPSGPITVIKEGFRGDGHWAPVTVAGPVFTYVPVLTVTTFAGSERGYADGPAFAAKFLTPSGVALDASENLFVADGNRLIRRIAADGQVTTFAGSTEGCQDGVGTAAQFRVPTDVAVDGDGNLYVVDRGCYVIRKITPSRVVTTLAGDGTPGFQDGTGSSAKFGDPTGIAVDGAGNLYVADLGNHLIRHITPDGEVTTLAGDGTIGFLDGPAAAARFSFPMAVALDGAGNVYVTDQNGIRKIDTGGEVTTILSGVGGWGLAVDAAGYLYLANTNGHVIRKITQAGDVSTLAGTGEIGYNDGPVDTAKFFTPWGIAVTADGRSVYVSEADNDVIRRIWEQ